jgi:hypothetical protein
MLLAAVVVLGAAGCKTQPSSGGSGGTGVPAGATLVVSVPSAFGYDIKPLAISADESTVVYATRSNANGPYLYYVRDLHTSTTTPLGHNGTGGAATAAVSAGVSADGRYVAFASKDPGLRPGPTETNCHLQDSILSSVYDVPCYEVYLRDMATGETVPVTGATASSTEDNIFPDVSTDGRYVTYTADPHFMVNPSPGGSVGRRWDRLTGETVDVPPSPSGMVSSDGRYRFVWDNHTADITVTDLTTNVDDVLTNGDVFGVQAITSDGSEVLTNCDHEYPRSWCLIDRVTHARRDVPGLPDYPVFLSGDGTRLLGIKSGGDAINPTVMLLLWTI